MSTVEAIMSSMRESELPFRLFDAGADVAIVQRRLPHWSQPGTLCFVTWRTNDSLPKQVLDRWHGTRRDWLLRHGIIATSDDEWRSQLRGLQPQLRNEFYQTLAARWQEHLDDCHGACVLKRPDLGEIVANSLRHFDGDRYDLTDFVVMPNHAHVLVAFPDEESLLDQCDSWKHFTATQLNRKLGTSGRFWQQDGFDHLVRSVDQFEYLRRYIAENPLKAHLVEGQFAHYSKSL